MPRLNFCSKTFFFFMATNICLASITYFVLPETKQIALEEMDTLFGGVSHVEKGAAIIQEDANVAETIGEEANDKRAVPMQDMTRGNDKRV